MRIDWYTKGILTVIAVLLGMIACRQYISPDAVAQAQGPFAGVEYVVGGGRDFFDSRTGELWTYGTDGKLYETWHLTKLGAPLVKEK